MRLKIEKIWPRFPTFSLRSFLPRRLLALAFFLPLLFFAAWRLCAGSALLAQADDAFVTTFPQVAQGALIETVLTLTNPQAVRVQVTLESFSINLGENASFELQPGETREILFTGAELQVGWIRLRAAQTVSAAARIVTRPAPGSEQILSQVTVLGQPEASRAALPVFRNRPGLDETGIALALFQAGTLRLILNDSAGEMVAAATLAHPPPTVPSRSTELSSPGHQASFLFELFPHLPEGFESGSLIIEQAAPEGLPGAFSVLALYTHEGELQTVPIQQLAFAGHYALTLPPLEEPSQEVVSQLAAQYGFRLNGPGQRPGEFLLSMNHNQASGLAGDPRAAELKSAAGQLLSFEFSFQDGAQQWEEGFADLPSDADPDFYQLAFQPDLLPAQLGNEGALRIQGDNHSDDLFMFLKRRLTGLAPNTAYKVHFYLELATQAPREVAGVGGAPGESVYVKAGASLEEPSLLVDDLGWFRLNLDKGNQASGGRNALVLGNAAKISTVFSDLFALKSLATQDSLFEISTDDAGAVWLLVGTDSGFEGKTTLYYNRIVATFFPQ